ncbi:hypothetical protein ACFOD4_04520 [Pseudoroseomonas globiformis]|uniref:Uncharacterized protein n=1 Tax=Teichococcus globiformis TaxID=2307229 RepID=A0ABV7G0W9_9PROT
MTTETRTATTLPDVWSGSQIPRAVNAQQECPRMVDKSSAAHRMVTAIERSTVAAELLRSTIRYLWSAAFDEFRDRSMVIHDQISAEVLRLWEARVARQIEGQCATQTDETEQDVISPDNFSIRDHARITGLVVVDPATDLPEGGDLTLVEAVAYAVRGRLIYVQPDPTDDPNWALTKLIAEHDTCEGRLDTLRKWFPQMRVARP